VGEEGKRGGTRRKPTLFGIMDSKARTESEMVRAVPKAPPRKNSRDIPDDGGKPWGSKSSVSFQLGKLVSARTD